MEESQVLTDIINCFTSIDQLLTFAHTYGLQDDPTVQLRLAHLRRQTNPLHIKCTTCGELFRDQEKYDLHVVYHETIRDFDLNVFDEPHSVSTHAQTINPHKRKTSSLVSSTDTTQGSPPTKKKASVPQNQYGAGVDTPSTHKISKKRERTYTKNGAIDTTYDVKFSDNLQNKKLMNIVDDLHKIFDDVLGQVREGSQDNSLARLIIEHNGLTDPIVVPLQELKKMDASTVMDEIGKVLQSNEELPVDDSFSVTVGRIDIPSGGGRVGITKLMGENNSIERKRSLISRSSETMCMPMAISICFLKSCRTVSPDEWKTLTSEDKGCMADKVLKYRSVPMWFYRHVMDKGRKACINFAKRLCKLADVRTDKPCNIKEIERFEKVVDLQILVISAKLGNKFIRIGENETDRKKVFLYLIETDECKHFAAIVSITGFFSSNHFCTHCLKPYSDKGTHSCETTCTVCCSSNCILTDTLLSCRACNRTCRSIACFQRHTEEKKVKKGPSYTECEKRYQCKTCKKVLITEERPTELHQCGEWKCPCCLDYQPEEHLCYQRAINTELTDKQMIFFDCETTQDTLLQCESGHLPSVERCLNCKDKDKACTQCKLCQNCGKSSCGTNEHKVNFICMQTACDRCKDKQISHEPKCNFCGVRCSMCDKKEKKVFKNDPCLSTCGFRERIFRGEHATDAFCRRVFTEQYKNGVVLSHNGSGYDNYFLIDWLISNSIRPDIIFNGTKIMYMLVGRGLNIRVLDSLNFLPMKLSKVPKAFGLKELKKGYFPHFFNTMDNQSYIGPYPDIKYYGCDYMNTDDRRDFLTWYRTKTNEEFDFAKEIREYCCSDTTILREGVLRFRDLMLEVTGTENTENTSRQSVDVLDYVTIASVCMGIYKTNFLKEQYDVEVKMQDTDHIEMKPMKSTQKGFDIWDQETWKSSDMFLSENSQRSFGQRKFVRSPLAHVPSEGYTKRFNHSRSSILWLEWMMNDENVFIQHALNRGEFKIPGTKFHVDGYCQETNDVFEFLGCHWHGCRKCFPCERNETKSPLTKQSMEELYVITKKREQTIRGLGYGYRRIWEHEFASRLNSNTRLKIFAENHEIEERLDPRHAFFGGRTDTTKLYHKVGKDEQIKYVDFTSLYPWTNKYCRYPLHHPEIITKNFEDLDKYFGLCHVKILPPTNLYHAVLPYRCNGKLTFPLCRTCAETTNQYKCTHNDQERCITGTYATPEIMLAQKKGYRVLKVHEVWHFPDSTQYDKKTNSGGLFTDYVQMFLKIKQEASGFPPHCTSEEDKREYIRLYKENEGIDLNYDNIKVNPGLRSLAKLCLNSFWGKFGQRLFLKRHSFFHESEADKFFQIVSDPTKVVENFHIVSNDTIQLEWSQHSKFPPVDVKTNIFIAIFTTMWARLKLYEVLDMLDERVLYTDTDSCIYVSKKGKPEPSLGNYLGDLTSEIPADEGYIVEFVSGGPKNYAYRTLKSETCKVKGFTLNFTNSNIVNFNSVKEMITSNRDMCKTLTNPTKICRLPNQRKLFSREEKKKYKFTYDKRVILSNCNTVPYGYK